MVILVLIQKPKNSQNDIKNVIITQEPHAYRDIETILACKSMCITLSTYVDMSTQSLKTLVDYQPTAL